MGEIQYHKIMSDFKRGSFVHEAVYDIQEVDVSVAQLVASVSAVVLGGVALVVGSNLARGKIFKKKKKKI